MPESEHYFKLTEHEQYRAVSDNLTHNSYIAVKYLMC